MAKRKRNIDFIAAQKAMGKSGQSTSFEFILVVSVVVVACAMIGWYLVARSQYNTAAADLDAARTELNNQKNTLSRNEEKFKKFQVKFDNNGNPMVSGTDRYGNAIYQYESLTEVATRVATALAGAQATSEEVKASINLTGTVFDIIFTSANKTGCTVTQFTFNNGKITLKLTGKGSQSMRNYVSAIKENGNDKYIANVESSMDTDTEFSVSFDVVNDKLYDGSDK